MKQTVSIAHNAVNAKLVGADRDAKLLAREALSFLVDGAEHMSAFGPGRWDGRSSFFDFKSETFPAGFVYLVWAKLRNAGYPVNLVRKPFPVPLGPCAAEGRRLPRGSRLRVSIRGHAEAAQARPDHCPGRHRRRQVPHRADRLQDDRPHHDVPHDAQHAHVSDGQRHRSRSERARRLHRRRSVEPEHRRLHRRHGADPRPAARGHGPGDGSPTLHEEPRRRGGPRGSTGC
jgi:hypothetical protein